MLDILAFPSSILIKLFSPNMKPMPRWVRRVRYYKADQKFNSNKILLLAALGPLARQKNGIITLVS